MISTHRLRTRSLAALAAASLALAACGSSDGASSSAADATESTAPGDGSVAAADGTEAGDTATTGGSATDATTGATGTETGGSTAGTGSGELQENGPVVVSGEALAPWEQGGDDPAVGATAPVLEGQDFAGTPVEVGAATGEPTMVVFLAHWCPHCQDEVPVLVGMRDGGTFPEGVAVVGVSTAVDPTRGNYPPSTWLDAEGWTWPVLADDEQISALSAYGGTSFPFVVLLDGEGTVLARTAGEMTEDQVVDFLGAVDA